jgi:hypothetical protein
MLQRLKSAALNLAEVFSAILLAALLLSPANPYLYLPNIDNGFFLYAGRLILKGGLPYVAFWDSKPPGIFYMDALGLWLGHDSRWGVWLLEFIFLSLTILTAYQLLKKLWQPGAAIFSTTLWVCALIQLLVTGNLIEEYPLLFNFLALWFFVQSIFSPRKRSIDFLIGLTAAVSFLFRANNIGVQISIIAAWLLWGIFSHQVIAAVQRVIVIGAGGLTGLVAASAYLWHSGILTDTFNASILYNFAYVGGHGSMISSTFDGFSYIGLPAWITLGGYLVLLLFIGRHWGSFKTDPVLILITILWPLEIILSGLSGRGYEHYFVSWIPAIALINGFLYHQLSELPLFKKATLLIDRWPAPIFLGLSLLLFMLNNDAFPSYRHTLKAMLIDRETPVEKSSPLSEYIRQHTNSNEKVLIWGEGAAINYLTHRDAPTAYLWYPFYTNSPFTSGLANGYYQEIKGNKPVLVMDPYLDNPDNFLSLNPVVRQKQLTGRPKNWLANQPANLLQVLDFFDQNYKFAASLDGVAIYRLKISP